MSGVSIKEKRGPDVCVHMWRSEKMISRLGPPSASVSMSVHIPASAISANYEEDDISRSSDASEEDNKELETFDDWIEEERPCKSLFDDNVLDSVTLAIEYDSKTHGFDIGAVSKRLGLSDDGTRVSGPDLDSVHLGDRIGFSSTGKAN